jgi:hypothetical protein
MGYDESISRKNFLYHYSPLKIVESASQGRPSKSKFHIPHIIDKPVRNPFWWGLRHNQQWQIIYWYMLGYIKKDAIKERALYEATKQSQIRVSELI